MKIVLLASLMLVGLASTAAAKEACPAKGTPLFEIHRKSDAKSPTSTTKLYSTGAWTFTPIDEAGKAGTIARGCFDKTTLATLRTLVQSAPWKVTLAQITCEAYSPHYTVYFVRGKKRYTSRLCGAESLDAKSATSLAEIHKIVTGVVPKPAEPSLEIQ